MFHSQCHGTLADVHHLCCQVVLVTGLAAHLMVEPRDLQGRDSRTRGQAPWLCARSASASSILPWLASPRARARQAARHFSSGMKARPGSSSLACAKSPAPCRYSPGVTNVWPSLDATAWLLRLPVCKSRLGSSSLAWRKVASASSPLPWLASSRPCSTNGLATSASGANARPGLSSLAWRRRRQRLIHFKLAGQRGPALDQQGGHFGFWNESQAWVKLLGPTQGG